MKRVVLLGCLALLVVGGWALASRLSSDAIGMALGLTVGVLAGVPASILVLLAGRRASGQGAEAGDERHPHAGAVGAYPSPQMPVIVLAAPPYYGTGQTGAPHSSSEPLALPGPAMQAGQRVFRIVGESDQAVGEW